MKCFNKTCGTWEDGCTLGPAFGPDSECDDFISEPEQAGSDPVEDSPSAGSKPTLDDLKAAIAALDCERLQAQISGLETGFEHPNVQTLYNRVLTISQMA